MLKGKQIQLVQIAARQAGLRGTRFEGRYHMLLGQYKQSSGEPVTSCKQLNGFQMEEFLAICESMGFRCKGKPDDHFRQLVSSRGEYASPGQKIAIKNLVGDLGWTVVNLNGFIKKMTKGEVDNISEINSRQAWKIIEAFKNMVSKKTGKKYNSLKEIKDDFTQEAKDGKNDKQTNTQHV